MEPVKEGDMKFGLQSPFQAQFVGNVKVGSMHAL